MLEKFKNRYQPSSNCIFPSEEIIKEYKNKVPDLLIEIWRTTGLGKYNEGIIELINPKDYEASLWIWLGKQVLNYVPFAISGFGELFYYRKLTETDEDICIIDIQYRKIETLAWDMEFFFEDFLINEEDRKEWLREELFKQAISVKGSLLHNEIFALTPVLAMGGAPELKYLQKGNAQVYQDLVFQMTK
ncbi:T6SS immunity protein Tdi1 domain-containing protein [Flavobacterium piscis]|uniref:DUF1851 domain-containing protein n=1 Tax=Flavobacterium piscis TaxID=1114874 RepID=A0ABU1YFJ7_9FLAO|nr:T6SS immunity protein Tdi1 domain-containing protein [Flavobacterium piscis]MDR7212336.1 hypothetical protein [Flavobacterium piscis]